MMKYTENTIQESIMGRRDCNEELRHFFDENMQNIYQYEFPITPRQDYNLKFTAQVSEPTIRKEQRMIELIKHATLAGDKEKLKMLQEFGSPVLESRPNMIPQPTSKDERRFSGQTTSTALTELRRM